VHSLRRHSLSRSEKGRGSGGQAARSPADAHRLSEERAKAAAARRREAGLLTEVDAIDRRLADKRKQVAALDGRIRRTQADVASLQVEIGRLQNRQVGQQAALERRLVAMYKLEAWGGVLPLLLEAGDPAARAVELRHLATLAAVDARLIREYRLSSEGLADRKSQREVLQRELGALRSEADGQRAEADREAGKRRVLLARVKDERSYHERMVGELSEAARRLEAFIRELQDKQRRLAKVPPAARSRGREGTPATGFGAFRGRLLWPAEGKVVADFGVQVNPRFGTKTFRNGIDIGVPEGTSIAAVYVGHVLYTGWFRGYGNLIIVDHGNEYYTLYAHVAEIKVKEGDEVKQGQSIGTVGDTGSLQGPRLYFEVRYEGRPQDPSLWLQPRG
jgi:septal ring factor EnvC (AmiA/AmiB activator)